MKTKDFRPDEKPEEPIRIKHEVLYQEHNKLLTDVRAMLGWFFIVMALQTILLIILTIKILFAL